MIYFALFLLLGCSFSTTAQNTPSLTNQEAVYKTDLELASMQSPFNSWSDEQLSQWYHQFPAPVGMKNQKIDNFYKSKYLYETQKPDKTGKNQKWIRFSLDANDEGTSPNSKYVRTELRHQQNWL